MLLLVVGLTWCVSSVAGRIPPWSPACPQVSDINNACPYGNLTVTLFSKTMRPKDCNSQVNVKEFLHNPVILIDSDNKTEQFTVLMVDMGPEGKGPAHLQWMVTNVTVDSLRNYHTIPPNNLLADYKQPLIMQGTYHQTLVQILVFRHHNVLRVPFGELWVKQTRNFSLRTLFSNTYPNLRLCGPVAGTQYWLYDTDLTPSAPPAPGQPMQPVAYVPVLPVYPVGQAPAQPVAPAPASHPAHPPVPDQHQHIHTTFPKKSSAPSSHPLQMLFIPLVIIVVMWL